MQRKELQKAEMHKPLQKLNVPYMALREGCFVAAVESPGEENLHPLYPAVTSAGNGPAAMC